jgi:hypothetical protein
MSTTLSMPVENHNFKITAPPSVRSGDATRTDSYSMVTPNVVSSASWNISTEPVELAHELSTSSDAPLSFHPGHNEAWMPTEFNTNNAMSHLANGHFPDMGTLHGEPSGVEDMTSLDTMNMGEGGGDWDVGKEWASGTGVGSDCYGFPLHGSFSNSTGLGDSEKFGTERIWH